MKTYREFENQDLDLDKYLKPMDEVDEELWMHCAEIVSPQYFSGHLLQMGEADDTIDGVYFYSSFITVENRRHFFLGSLPEFKQ